MDAGQTVLLDKGVTLRFLEETISGSLPTNVLAFKGGDTPVYTVKIKGAKEVIMVADSWTITEIGERIYFTEYCKFRFVKDCVVILRQTLVAGYGGNLDFVTGDRIVFDTATNISITNIVTLMGNERFSFTTGDEVKF